MWTGDHTTILASLSATATIDLAKQPTSSSVSTSLSRIPELALPLSMFPAILQFYTVDLQYQTKYNLAGQKGPVGRCPSSRITLCVFENQPINNLCLSNLQCNMYSYRDNFEHLDYFHRGLHVILAMFELSVISFEFVPPQFSLRKTRKLSLPPVLVPFRPCPGKTQVKFISQ